MLVALLALAATGLTAQVPRPLEARLDSIFAPWNSDTSAGCVLAIAQNGSTMIERAWGSADLREGLAAFHERRSPTFRGE